MPRFRLFLAWLVLAALPLQGFAAATMLFCGIAPSATVAQAGKSDDHGAHAHPMVAGKTGHDHGSHGHSAADGSKADLTIDGGTAGQDTSSHSCSICAACCHIVAVGSFAALPQLSAAPNVEPVHPTLRVATRTSNVPDKPPRA